MSPALPRRSKDHRTAQQWREWARLRRAEADVIAARYRRQAEAAEKMALNNSCPCDPIIVINNSSDGPVFANPMITHSLDCKDN